MMMQTTPSLAERPAPVRHSADWLVLLVLLVSLCGAWVMRQTKLNATDVITVPDANVQLAIPAGGIAQMAGGDLYAVTTPAGLTVRVNTEPLPPIGGDLYALVTFRATSRGDKFAAFTPLATQVDKLDGRPMAVMEFKYAEQKTKFHSADLRVIHGYELVIPIDKTVYLVSLEAPDGQWDLVTDQWPRLLASLRFNGGK